MGRDRINSAMHKMHNGSAQRACLVIALSALLAPSAKSIGQSEDLQALSSTLHFSPQMRPAAIRPMPRALGESMIDGHTLRFDADPMLGAGSDRAEAHDSSLSVLAELTLLRVRNRSTNESTSLDQSSRPREVSLRFNEARRAGSIWGDSAGAASGIDRWEVIPDLYIRSGQVHDAGYESLDYADLYAELGVDLTSNTGIWLRYERLRQALGSSREGEQVDADALYLQFELRF